MKLTSRGFSWTGATENRGRPAVAAMLAIMLLAGLVPVGAPALAQSLLEFSVLDQDLEPQDGFEVDVDDVAYLRVSGLVDDDGGLLDGTASLGTEQYYDHSEAAYYLVQARLLAGLPANVSDADVQSMVDDGTWFTDVDPAAELAPYIAFNKLNDIFSGCAVDRYCGDRPLRRDQQATLLVRALELHYPGREIEDLEYFDDVSSSGVHAPAISILVEEGILPAGGSFRPWEAITAPEVLDWLSLVQAWAGPGGSEPTLRTIVSADVTGGTALFPLAGSFRMGMASDPETLMQVPVPPGDVTYRVMTGGATVGSVTLTWIGATGFRPVRELEAEVSPGETVSTDPSGGGPTEQVPVVISLTSPTAGSVSIAAGDSTTEDQVAAADAGYRLFGETVVIEAPAGTVDAPLRLVFVARAELLVTGDVAILRNGVPVSSVCAFADRAAPDPCLASITRVDGNVRVEVLTSRASRWVLALKSVACPLAATPPAGFSDLTGSVHDRAIGCVVDRGIVRGFDDGRFRPGSNSTRAQSATIMLGLLKAAGVDLPPAPPRRFDDISGSVHASAIDTLADLGIIRGVEDRTFAPSATVTRAQLVSMLVRLVEQVEQAPLASSPPAPFQDVSGVHAPNINSAASVGLVQGITDDWFAPGAPVTRGQTASFATRVLDRWAAQERLAD